MSVKAKIREANLQQVKIIITISYYYYCYINCIIVGSWYVIQCILFVRSHFESWWRTMKRGHDCRTNDSGFDENSIYFMCFAEFYVSFFFSAVLFLFNPMRLSWSFMRRFICKNGICPPANAPPPALYKMEPSALWYTRITRNSECPSERKTVKRILLGTSKSKEMKTKRKINVRWNDSAMFFFLQIGRGLFTFIIIFGINGDTRSEKGKDCM